MSGAGETHQLPEDLPIGETLLWQGRPNWWRLARDAFHLRGVAIYFALLMAWRFAVGLHDGLNVAQATASAFWLLPLACSAIGILMMLGWLNARSTLYTITTRRVVLRFGIALPMTLNLPFTKMSAAALRLEADGSGDIALSLSGRDRIAYLVLWPFARGWRLSKPEPLLRGLPDAARPARLLADALAATHGTAAPATPLSVTAKANPSQPQGAALA